MVRRTRLFSQSFTQLGGRNVKAVVQFPEGSVAPQPTLECFFRHHLAWRFEQDKQELEGQFLDFYPLFIAQ